MARDRRNRGHARPAPPRGVRRVPRGGPHPPRGRRRPDVDSRRARDDRAGHGGLRQYRWLGCPRRAARRSPPWSSTASPSSSPTATSSARPTPERLQAAFPDAEIIVFGHTHRPLLTLVDVVVTVMNPGGAGPRRFDLPASVGILELEPGIPPRGRLVPADPAGSGLARCSWRSHPCCDLLQVALRRRRRHPTRSAHPRHRRGLRRRTGASTAPSWVPPQVRITTAQGSASVWLLRARTPRSWRRGPGRDAGRGQDALAVCFDVAGDRRCRPGARRLPVDVAAGAGQQRGISRPRRPMGASARRPGLAARSGAHGRWMGGGEGGRRRGVDVVLRLDPAWLAGARGPRPRLGFIDPRRRSQPLVQLAPVARRPGPTLLERTPALSGCRARDDARARHPERSERGMTSHAPSCAQGDALARGPAATGPSRSPALTAKLCVVLVSTLMPVASCASNFPM